VAFTSVQKRDIRKYLGAPFGFYDLNTRLESMMDTVGANNDDQTEVGLWLTELATIDTALSTTATSASYTHGPLKAVDEVEFYNVAGGEDSSDRIGAVDRGRILILRIARALGVDDVLPYGDYFGTSRGQLGALRLG